MFVAAALAIFLPERLAVGQETAAQAQPPIVAAYVNDQPIHNRVLEQAMQASTLEGSIDRRLQRQQVLRTLINTELLYQESKARNIQVSDSAIALELVVLRRSPSAYPAMLTFVDEPSEMLAARIARKLAIEKLMDQLAAQNAVVEPGKIRAFYESHREDFLRKEEVRLGHILLLVPAKDTLADIWQRKRIEALRQRVVAGEEFSAIARCCSDDKMAAKRGGDRGYFTRETLPSEIADVAFKLPLGEVSQVIKNEKGYHLIIVLAHLAEKHTPLEQVEDAIQAQLEQKANQRHLEKLLAELESRAKVVVVARK